ncbi:MAG: PAS domain S-box protein, partial [Chloroflexi bacterium]|nr:PAS domain S-box protein [Chloroflexota bacterium]
MAKSVRKNLESSQCQTHRTSGETFLSLEQECEHLAETLVELEEQYLVLLNEISEGVIVTQEGLNRYANRALSEITGWALDEIIGEFPFMNMILPTQAARHIPESAEDSQTGLYSPNRFQINCKDGTTKDVEMTTRKVRYGHRDAHMTILKDITEYQRIEVALLESEEKFRVILDSTTSPIIYYDLEGNILLSNIAGAEWMGGSPDSIIGRCVHDIFPIEGQAILRRVRRVAERSEGSEYEDKVLLSSGERWFMSRFEPVRDGTGSIFAVQTISHDVTEHKHLGEAWRDLSRRLVEVQEQERRHIASELHDQIGQNLTGLKMMFGRIQTESGTVNRGILDEANQVLDELVERVRELSLNLRPSMLDDLGLVPSILWLVERYSLQTGIQVDFRHKGVDRSLPIDVATAAYRIVQESLTNIARHANVNKAAIWLLFDGKT